MAEQPTAEEIAAYEAQFGPAKPQVNPLRDLSAEDIAALAVKDKEHFIIPDEFARAKDLHGDPAFVQKVADAFNIVNQRGFKAEDLPTVPQAAGAVGTAIKGLAGQAWNYANVAGNLFAGAASELVGAEGLATGYAENIDKRLAENIAGTEEAMTGIAQLGTKGVRKAGQALGIAKDFKDFSPAEKVTELFNKSGESEVRTERLTGKGEFAKAVTGGVSEEVDLDPEKVGTLAAGDPFSFYLFGAGAGAVGKGVKALTPAIAQKAAAAVGAGVGRAAETVLPKVVGGGLTAAGVTAKGAAKAVETVAPAAGAIGGGIAGGTSFGVPGAIGGVGAGLATGKAVARAASFTGRQAEKIADIGRQVSGSVPIKSAYAQAGRDFLQALPGATWDVAKGTALDIGLAAATAEVPQDVQGAVGFGTALGALGGAAKIGGRVLSGQLIAPRAYGVNTVLPSSGHFRGLDTMHADAIKAATPGVRARLNAMREFANGVAPGTDIFLGRDSAAVKQALLDTGLDPGLAESWSQAEGFFTANLPGKDGQPRRVVIARNVDSVPHEAQHVIQDVLGEQANQKIDAIIKETYADGWDAEGQKYADRITQERDPRHWREVILDETGTGLSEAKEKIYRDIHNRLEGESGATPSPRLVEEMAKAELGRVMDEAVARHPDADPNAIGQHVWRDVFSDSPGDVVAISDKYIAREIAAENFDALFKNQGPRLAEGTQLPQRLARIIGGVMSALGVEPLSGRVSELGGTPLSSGVIAAVRSAAKGLQGAAAPVVTPRAPATPRVRVAPGTPAAIETAAEEARTLAAEAPAEIAVGGTRSPRELLGQIAESIANQEGVRINYLSAPGEPAAATTSNRTVRREIIEAFRTMPPEARALWEKTFFPERVIRTKSGAYQVQGWAPEVFASNAHKVAKFFAETPGSEVLSPYAVDVASKTFTPEAWQELYVDTQDFVQNQMRGATGSGEPLVVPRSVTEAGGFQPPTRPGATPLAQNKADFINALFNFKLPETPRVQTGKRPLNVMGQEVSAATIPGRVEVPVRPRGEFTGPEATRQGIEGVSIAEVNPFRNQLELAAQTAGKTPPSFIEAIQKLNLENIKEVEGTPEVPQFRGNTLTLTAGLQPAIQQRATERTWTVSGQVRGVNKQITVSAPDIAAARKLAEAQNMRISRVENADKMVTAQLAARTDTGRRVAEERGFEIRHTGTPENPGVAMFKEGVPVGEISAVRNSPIEADIDNIKVNQGFRGQGLSEILYREMGKRLQDEGVETVTGMIIDKRALAGRSKIFPETRIENEIQVGEGAPAYEVRSPISATAQFNPAELAARVEKFTPEEFRAWTASPEGKNFTGVAHDMGLQAPDQAFVDSLLQRYKAVGKKATDLMAGLRSDPATMLAKLDDISALGSQAQFFREAYEAATGTAGGGDALRKADPNYKPPFPIEAKAQLAAPKANEEVKKLADSYAKSRGLTLPAERKYATAPEPLLKDLADFYDAAKDAPDSPEVKASYDALTRETAEQYQQMLDAGYTIEPWTKEGQPYPNSEAMVADVRDNKHLSYFPTDSGYGNVGDVATKNAMLRDSGVVIDGKPIPFNDLFRAVHDFFGHAKEGYQFGPRGEFNAWGTHSEMYSPEAQGALAGETLAQNAFVNFGPHMRDDAGTIRKQGEEGYLSATERPFAEQKNVVVPQELIDNARAQFAGKKKGEDKYKLKPPGAGFSKAWILPSGDPVQLGGKWHHQWLAENPEVASKYKLNVPDFKGGDAEGVRESALKAGFARVNHSQNSGTLTVEARAKDWRRVKPAIERMVESNLDDIDNMHVTLMDESATKVVDSQSAKLFNYDSDAEKLQHLPFITEGEVRGQFAPKKPKTKEEVQKMLGDEVATMAANHPEALPLDYQKNKNGTFKLDADNKPVPIGKAYELHETPLAKRAAASYDTKEAKEAAIVDAYAEKIEGAYAQAAKNPAILAGKDWYELTRRKLKKLFGVDTKLFCEILGATSANTPVDTNFRFAIDAYNKFKAGDYDAVITKYKEGKDIWDSGDLATARALDTENFLGENPTRAKFREFWIKHHDLKPKQSNGKLFGFNSGAVLRVFDGSWRAEIDAPKTPNFADNLSGDSFEATIDIWVARLMRRLGHEGSEGPWRILAKNEAGVSDPDFYMSQKAFRKAGDKLGVSPDALQAIVWFLEKDLWDKSGWTKEVGAKKADFNAFLDITTRGADAGKLTINEIRPKSARLAPEKVSLVEPKKSTATVVAMPQEDAEKIADAIYKAEGGTKARKPYGILSVKVADEAEARKVALNTIKNNYKRWQVAGKPGEYLEFLAGKYAPIGVANDPKALNKNWLKNVKAGLAK